MKKELASYLHRAATTTYPCYIPVLGGSAGAGRIRLARTAKVENKTDSSKQRQIYKKQPHNAAVQ